MNASIINETARAREIYLELKKEYGFNVPLQFKNLNGRGGGFVEFTRSTKNPSRIVIDNSGQYCCEQDYCLCHEVAHVILLLKKKSAGHTKAHSNLTYKIALKYNLV